MEQFLNKALHRAARASPSSARAGPGSAPVRRAGSKKAGPFRPAFGFRCVRSYATGVKSTSVRKEMHRSTSSSVSAWLAASSPGAIVNSMK